MNATNSNRTIGVLLISLIAILFGLLTIKSGGMVLFVDGPDRAAAGNYVPFVLWFNFIAGFFYILAGIGLWFTQRWAVWLAGVIVISTLVVFALLNLHIYNDGLFEFRTVIAMSLRSVVWSVIAFYAYLKIR
ncbi:MAG: hypothetical protein U9N50_01120 [Pseudomonadota bacterium]|nr:hypothetical protein [Pseudomonadota bacterium]